MAKSVARRDRFCPRCGGDWDETGERCAECGAPARQAKKKSSSQRLSKDAFLTRYDSAPRGQRIGTVIAQLGLPLAFMVFFTSFLFWNFVTGTYNGVQMTASSRWLTLFSSIGSLSITTFLVLIGCRIIRGPSAPLERLINIFKWIAGAFLLILVVWFATMIFTFRRR